MKVNKFFLKVLAHLNYKYTYYSNLLHYPYRGYEAMQYLLENESFNTVLDVGCGEGIHSNIFYENGKEVTAIDYGGSSYFKKGESSDVKWKRVVGDVNKYEFDRQFDCIWCSHVLEHQLNPHDFLVRLHDLCRVGGGNCDYRPADEDIYCQWSCIFMECRNAVVPIGFGRI